MRRTMYISAAVLVFMSLLPTRFVFAQKALPKVPITYPGDTDNSIAGRAQWVEGAKKEGALVWWGIGNPKELAKWLDAKLIEDAWRPVRLDKGVYFGGKIEFS